MNDPRAPFVERRATPRGGVANDWRDAQPDAWRLAAFKMQIAEEARARREKGSLKLAMLFGGAIGLAGSVIALFG